MESNVIKCNKSKKGTKMKRAKQNSDKLGK